MSERTQKLMVETPIKAEQVSFDEIAEDARGTRPGMEWKLSLERARLLTESYKETEEEPFVLRRAMALAHILDNMTLYIRPGELIVGNFAPTPNEVCHYPEFMYRWVERETARGGPYEKMLNDDEREELKEIDAYWKKLAVHHIYRKSIPEDMADVIYLFQFECGTPNFEKILNKGLKGIIKEADERKKRLDKEFIDGVINGIEYVEKKDFLDGAIIALNGAIRWGKRYAKLAEELVEKEKDPTRKDELKKIAEICDWVPENPARTLYEAIQSYWFVHLIVNYIELPMVGDGIRFDQVMGPFLENDLKKGRITRDQAQELVECVFVKSQETGVLQPSIWTGAGGGAIGYQTLNIGGVDSKGDDITNEMSYIVLDAMKSIRTVTPPLALRWHDKMPKKLIDKSIEVMASGIPQPAIFNDKVNIPRLLGLGVPIEDARNYSINNCMVPTIPGKNLNHRSAWAGAVPVPVALNAALGISPGARLVGIGGGVPTKEGGKRSNNQEIVAPDSKMMNSVDELIDTTMKHFGALAQKLTCLGNIADYYYQEYTPRPFLSAVLDDSIERAQDVREWNYGPEYRDIVILGLNNAADAIAAIKKLVFEEKKVSMEELIEALKNDWDGYEELRQMCLDCPKFGNDDDYVDQISRELGRRITEEIKKCKTNFGNAVVPDGTVASSFWFAGRVCDATADGRHKGETLHDGSVSPVGSRDKRGPTAVLKSVSKVDPLISWNHLFNQSFMPDYLKGRNAELFADYLKTFGDLGIHHVQFSVVGRETLEDAQLHPEKHTDLMVRVCGYSAYFIDLNKSLQDSIISRSPQCF